MHLHCPHCGSPIEADDIHLDNEVAKCRTCNAVFSFAHAVAEDDAERTAAGPRKSRRRPDAPMPKGLMVEDWGPNLRFIRRWFSVKFIALAFFCAIWDGFLFVWYSIAFGFSHHGGPGGGPALCFMIFPLGHVAVGVGLTWYTLCGLFNRTVIDIGGGRLTIRHGPLPYPGNRTLDAMNIDQFYCRECISRNDNSTSVSYELHAIDISNKKTTLLKGLDDMDMALYLEQEIERRLNIPDREVPGEVRGAS